MTQIQDLFVYPISRTITTVIKMNDLRLREIQQELEEYIVTESIESLLIEFLERYVETRTGQTDRIGVWLSGFFGSGKSHFAKILSYLLENRSVDGRSAVDMFKLRIVSSSRQREMEGLLHQVTNFIDTFTIGFQIKTEEDLLANVPGSEDAIAGNHISTIMYRQWLQKRGLSTTLWVAKLELELIELGQYEAFKTQVHNIEGREWAEVRQHDMLVRDTAVSALCALMPARYPSPERASKALDDIQAGLQMGPALLASELARWNETRLPAGAEKSPHVAFIIDEMGQFIGGDNQKLLELQSIAEAFASRGPGKLWLIVTAQEALEEIVRDAIRRENEFDKIRDRFNLRLHLTSENIETVLEERILKKKESQRPHLEKIYSRSGGNIATVCTLEGANRPLPQPDQDRFAADYPFPPYQLAILQQIFAAVRTPGGQRERIEGTERSLIGVTQAILKSADTSFATSPLGRLVTFDEIYDQIENELPSIDRRTIDEVRLGDEPTFLKRILKALYLIGKLEWIPNTPENLARLLVAHVDDREMPFVQLKQRVTTGLSELERGHYVVESNGQYEYLSGVKKDIEMDIAAVNVTVNDQRREIKRYLKTVLDFGRLNYQGIKRFDVQVRGDDDILHDKGEMTLQVYSPIYVKATDLTRDEVVQRSYGDDRTLYWFPAANDALSRELIKLIQARTIVDQRNTRQDKSPEEASILFQKQGEIDTRQGKIQVLLRNSLLTGGVIYDGEVRELDGRTTQLGSVFTRELSEIVPHVYTRFEPAAVRVNEKSIDQILTVTQETQLPGIESELALFDDAYRLNRHSPVVSEMLEELRLRARAGDPRDGKTLTGFFESVPYGWDPILVRIVLAAMFRAGIISLKYEGRVYHDYKVSRARELLVKAMEFRKTEFLYDPQEGLAPQERRKVHEAIDRIFHRREPDTVNIMAAALEEELTALRSENDRQCVLVEQSGLPVKPILGEGRIALDEILEQTQPDRRLKAFLAANDTVRELKAYQDRLQEFIEANRPQEYRRVVNLVGAVNRGAQVVPELADDDVQGWLQEIATIQTRSEVLERWSAFYQNAQHLLQSYQAAYERLHQARYDAYAQVGEELTALQIPADGLQARLCEGPVGWTLDGLSCTTCGTGLETLYYQTQSAHEEKARLIAQAAPPSTDDDNDSEPKLVVIRLNAAIQTRRIRDEADLEAALQELREEIAAALDAGKHVILG